MEEIGKEAEKGEDKKAVGRQAEPSRGKKRIVLCKLYCSETNYIEKHLCEFLNGAFFSHVLQYLLL